MNKLSIFILLSIVLLYVPRSIFANMRSHALPRYFLWEMILGLILLNLEVWFVDPFSLRQIASWLLLILSIGIVSTGFITLIKAGRPQGQLENTTQLVGKGIYRYIRHPLYASLLCLAAGAFLKNISIQSVILIFLAIVFAILTAQVEEKENIQRFGQSYFTYMQTTKRFIPFFY